MWPFKRKKTDGAQEATLKTNVTAFWEWFASNSARFYDTIENKKCSDLTDEVSDAFDRWLPGMAWVFGPGENRIGHSLTISGEGVLLKQMVAKYCIGLAPLLPNWTFYASRQPSDKVDGFSLKMDAGTFKSDELWMAAYLNVQDEKVDIEAWHPLFATMEKGQRFMVLFLLLDEVLGEFGTGNWVGEIKIGDGRLKEAFPIWELKDYIAKVEAEKGWRKSDPTDGYNSWKTESKTGFARADIFTGTARVFRLVADYAEAKGPIEHPLEELGVDLVYVRIDRACLPKGKEIDFRCDIEDAIAARLIADRAGETLGGATGTDWAYIDLMLYDGQRSLEMVLEVLRKEGLPKDTHIRWFTSDKTDKVVRI